MKLFSKLFLSHRRSTGLDTMPPMAAPAAGSTERRKSGQLVEELVACAVEMRELEGTLAARSFLRYTSVPPAVIRRILSSSSQRRWRGAGPQERR